MSLIGAGGQNFMTSMRRSSQDNFLWQKFRAIYQVLTKLRCCVPMGTLQGSKGLINWQAVKIPTLPKPKCAFTPTLHFFNSLAGKHSYLSIMAKVTCCLPIRCQHQAAIALLILTLLVLWCARVGLLISPCIMQVYFLLLRPWTLSVTVWRLDI